MNETKKPFLRSASDKVHRSFSPIKAALITFVCFNLICFLLERKQTRRPEKLKVTKVFDLEVISTAGSANLRFIVVGRGEFDVIDTQCGLNGVVVVELNRMAVEFGRVNAFSLSHDATTKYPKHQRIIDDELFHGTSFRRAWLGWILHRLRTVTEARRRFDVHLARECIKRRAIFNCKLLGLSPPSGRSVPRLTGLYSPPRFDLNVHWAICSINGLVKD